jgi:hypothetical protein
MVPAWLVQKGWDRVTSFFQEYRGKLTRRCAKGFGPRENGKLKKFVDVYKNSYLMSSVNYRVENDHVMHWFAHAGTLARLSVS